MPQADLPQHVQKLIVRHIDSVQQVEILALLEAEPARSWQPEEISRTLQIAPAACRGWLDELATAGLVAGQGMTFRGGAGQRSTRKAVDDLLDLFGRRRVTVLQAIYGKPEADA
jgi:hypothetical protein